MLSTSPSPDPDKPSITVWIGILVIYLALFMATGYISFIRTDLHSKYERYEHLSTVEDEDTKEFLIDILQKEESEHINRRNLAGHSFHVVLGALLGFMSASAASLFRQKNED